MGSGIADAWNKAPERRAEGQAMVSRQNKMRMVDAERERFKSATGTVRQAFGDVKRDFTTPLDVTKGRMALPARIGKTGLDVVGAAFSPIAAGITELVGPEVQAATGIHRDTVGNLTSGVVPLGGITKLAKGTETGRAMTGAVSRAGGRLTAPLARAKAAGQRTFSPETIDEAARDTATLHRAAHGTRRGEASAERYALERHHRVVAKSSPAEQEALAKYVDTGGKVALPDKLKGAAEAMRGVYTRYRSRIENVLGEHEGPQFIKDYYARFWRNTPDEVDKAFRDKPIGGRQGSGRNLRKRSIPTYEEGLARGLKPVFTNPLDATAAYADNMASYLATHETLKGMRRTGLAKWAYKTKVPKNMVPLEGLGTTKPAMLNPKGAMIPERVLVAPDNAARVYNRTVSKGLDKGSFGPVYRGARAASNAVSQMKLGLSLFHATVMGEEGFVSAFAKGANRVLRGDIGGVKDMAKSPGAIVSTTAKGGRLRKAILDPDNAETHLKGMDPDLAKMYQRVGGRADMDRFYSTGSVSGGFWRGIKSGTLGHEFVDALRDVKSSPIKGTLRLVGKMLDTASARVP